jgi:hypothetical protein
MITHEMNSDPIFSVGSEYAFRSWLKREVKTLTITKHRPRCQYPWQDDHSRQWTVCGFLYLTDIRWITEAKYLSLNLIKDIVCDNIPRLLPTYFYDIS